MNENDVAAYIFLALMLALSVALYVDGRRRRVLGYLDPSKCDHEVTCWKCGTTWPGKNRKEKP